MLTAWRVGAEVFLNLSADLAEGGKHVTPTDAWVRKGDLLYLNQKLSPTFSERSGLQLPRDVRQLRGYGHIVKTETDLVNYRNEREGKDGNFDKASQ